MRQKTLSLIVVACLPCLASLASLESVVSAQEVALPELPIAGQQQKKEGEEPVADDREIDLANVVTSAAKGVTTVQEAPAIVTIITSEEMKARGYQTLNQALGSVPGWLDTTAIGSQVPTVLVRGVFQGALLLQDGISMFDPYANIASFNRSQPIETVKRMEIVTGPGGVLWGANSFLGIVNVIMKDAEDVNGLEVSAGYGDGPGNRSNFRAYAMFGKAFFKNRLKIFQHVSYENYIGSTWNIPTFYASSPAPQPPGPAFYGPTSEPAPSRSWIVNVTGKYTLGPVSLYYRVPFGNMYPQLIFANAVVPNTAANIYDRYAILEYKDRFWKDRLGFTVKGYYTQFVRSFSIQLFPTSSLFPPYMNPDGTNNQGGLHFDFQQQLAQRGGGTVDFDLNLKYGFRVLFGGEVFYESLSSSTVYFASHTGVFPTNAAVDTAAALPLICPQAQTGSTFAPVPGCPRQFLFDSDRIVGALYANLQYRPVQKLTLDGGVRIQKGFGQRSYDFTPLYSAAVVWNFAPDWHLKANYATGFRPTVFNNTDAAQGGISFGSNPNLKTETSQSFQGEINARLLRNVRKVRELEIRVDYAYTFLDRLIVIRQGSYSNTGQRAIHSVEAYAKLYLQGDHFLQASYSFLSATTSEAGVIRTVPSHVLSMGGSFNLVKNLLDVNANLLVTSAYEDPNRVATQPGGIPANGNIPASTSTARSSDLVWDRLTPIALLQLGVRLRFFQQKLTISGQFYNVLNQRYWYYDPFSDITPSIEMTPTPAPGFSFFASASYRL